MKDKHIYVQDKQTELIFLLMRLKKKTLTEQSNNYYRRKKNELFKNHPFNIQFCCYYFSEQTKFEDKSIAIGTKINPTPK